MNRINTEEALRLYSDGKSDGDIARHFGVGQSSATRWRQRQGLQPNIVHDAVPLSAERKRRARKMYREGATHEQVRRAIGCSRLTSKKLRRGLAGDDRLRLTGVSLKGERQQAQRDAATILAELKAVTRHVLDPTIRDDAIGEMFLAMMEGQLTRSSIKTEARRYCGRVFEQWQSKWGPASIDESITEDGLRLIDLIPCPRAQAWLDSIGG